MFPGKEQQECDEQREDAESFRHGEAEDQPAELAVGSRRIAQRARQIVAENGAEADTGAAHAETGNACADRLCCIYFHIKLLVDRNPVENSFR